MRYLMPLVAAAVNLGDKVMLNLSRCESAKRITECVPRIIGLLALLAGLPANAIAQQDGSIVAWGWNFEDQLNVPEPNADFVAVSAGGWHSLGLKSDGSIVAWGAYDWGQLNVPEPNADFVAVSGGGIHSLGLKADGSVVAWGSNTYGQANSPPQNMVFVAIAAGGKHSLGLKSDGSIFAWGYNLAGQLNVPEPNAEFVAVSTSGWHSLGLKSDGSIVAWGANNEDQLNVPEPNADFVAVSAGYEHSLGLKADGSIVLWGDDQTDEPEPNSGFVAIGGGLAKSIGLRSDGSIWDSGGGYDPPEPNIDFVAIDNGYYHRLVLRDTVLPSPPFLWIQTPVTNLELQQGQHITISWLDDAQDGAEIRLYFDPDTSSTPWVEGGSNEIAIPFSIDASNPINELTWIASNLDPGMYSIWGKSDNGVQEPVYSRAPGLVSVTEFTEDIEPEVDEDRISFESWPSPVFVHTSKNPTNLYIVTHGWNGPSGQNADHSWIQQVAEYVAAHISSGNANDQWDVAYYNWQQYAGGPIPAMTASVAWYNGVLIANFINDPDFGHNYEHIEVIAHSAGSWTGHALAGRLIELGNTAKVNLTLLDAFVPPLWSPLYGHELGEFANHVFNCYDTGLGLLYLWTQENLTNAFNADNTCRRTLGYLPDDPPYEGSPHSAPWAWYRLSTEQADSVFMDDSTYIYGGDGQTHPLGFKMSKAYHGSNSGWSEDMEVYPNNANNPFINICSIEPLGEPCSNNTNIFVLHSDTFDFTAMQSAVGDDGVIAIAPDNVELTTGVETAWVGFDVPIDRTISAVLFDVEFTSAEPDAEGYATGYWVGSQFSGSDERFADVDTPSTSSFLFFEPIPPGERVISFRLDANAGPISSVRISNLRIGMFIEGDINGDCVLSVDDFCAWVANPFDIDGNGVIDDQDQTLLATALGVSEADKNNNGIPDVCDCPWDLDDSGSVGTSDLLELFAQWGTPGPADFDGSGAVGTSDLLILFANWGPCKK